jgi:glycosyltransferase involved in cell wall biosynthesis
LILPSLYEGFGLPALEALACGTAVLASPAAAIETAAVMRLDPHDPVQMATAMQDILVDNGQRAVRVRQGLADVASCTWASAAEAVYQTLCQAAGEAGPAA